MILTTIKWNLKRHKINFFEFAKENFKSQSAEYLNKYYLANIGKIWAYEAPQYNKFSNETSSYTQVNLIQLICLFVGSTTIWLRLEAETKFDSFSETRNKPKSKTITTTYLYEFQLSIVVNCPIKWS